APGYRRPGGHVRQVPAEPNSSRSLAEGWYALGEVLALSVRPRATGRHPPHLVYRTVASFMTCLDAPAMSRRRQPLSNLLPSAAGTFVAIDFETADYGPDSACAVGLCRVGGLKVAYGESLRISPPRAGVLFTHVRGITWDMVKDAPGFADPWPRLTPLLDGASALAAHNAPFDRRVLSACCVAAGVAVPPPPFLCTGQLARRGWGLEPDGFPRGRPRLGIGVVHHPPRPPAPARGPPLRR